MTSGAGIAQGSPDYFGLIDEVTSMVTAVVPPSKTVLVVSKGDENLLQLGSRTGWHFPRTDDGRYAGHYPADGDDAVKQLEALRERGASHVVFPATSLWWLDYYPELSRHLDDRYTCLVRDEDACAIYDLTPTPATEDGAAERVPAKTAASSPAVATPDKQSSQLTTFLDNLLPENAAVSVVRSLTADDTHADRVASLRAEGVGFLVFPHGAGSTEGHAEFLGFVAQRHACIAHQRYLCSVYDLTQSTVARREKPAVAEKTQSEPRRLRFLGRRG